MKVLSVDSLEELAYQMRDGNHLVMLFNGDPMIIPQLAQKVDQVVGQFSNFDSCLVDCHFHPQLANDLHIGKTINYAIYSQGNLVKKLLIPDPSVGALKSFLSNVNECVYG